MEAIPEGETAAMSSAVGFGLERSRRVIYGSKKVLEGSKRVKRF